MLTVCCSAPVLAKEFYEPGCKLMSISFSNRFTHVDLGVRLKNLWPTLLRS